MEEFLQKIADALHDSGRFDNVSFDGDGMILIAEDGELTVLTGTRLENPED